jgi:hypothetical protein
MFHYVLLRVSTSHFIGFVKRRRDVLTPLEFAQKHLEGTQDTLSSAFTATVR